MRPQHAPRQLLDHAFCCHFVDPRLYIGAGLVVLYAELADQQRRRLLDRELLADKLFPKEERRAVERDDFGHVGVRSALSDDEILAGNLAHLVILLDFHKQQDNYICWAKI